MEASINMKFTRRNKETAVAVLAALLMVIGIGVSGHAVPVTPRSVGLADNSMPISSGIEALTDNPAALALEANGKWELRLMSLATEVGTNGLGFGDYRLYNGATLTAADKQDILNKIPADGLRLGAHAEASAVAFRSGSFGVRFSGYGTARGTIDRELLEILFYGNEQDRLYTSDLNSGEGLAAAELAVSYAKSVGRIKQYPLYAGLTIRLIRGLYYAELDKAEGHFVSGISGATGSGNAIATIARGGTGLGLNWGAVMKINSRYSLSCVLENAPGFIRWSRDAELKTYSLRFEGITADNFEDSLWVDEETSTSLGSFSRSLPARLRFGLGRTGSRLNTAVVLSFGFADRLAVSTTPELGLGAEYFVTSYLPFRTGFTVGGLDGFSAGLGGGIHLGAFHLELAARTAGGLWPTSGRGGTISLASGVHF